MRKRQAEPAPYESEALDPRPLLELEVPLVPELEAPELLELLERTAPTTGDVAPRARARGARKGAR